MTIIRPIAARVCGLGRAFCGCALTLAVAGTARSARPETPPGRVVVDRDVARFYAPETGGAAHPRFVDERTLALETRLEVMATRLDEVRTYPQEQVRAALDRHVTEELLASLARKLIEGSPAAKRPSDAELDRVGQDLGEAWFTRFGGRDHVDAIAAAEGFDPSEVDALVQRLKLAAFYLDRTVSPVLHPSEDVLRDVFRTAAHPYVGRPFEQVRAEFARWFVLERVRAAETAFYQTARSHVVVVITR